MSILIYSSRDFIPLPGRTVQTFPSGLVRVERSFACRRSAAPAYRELLRVGAPMPEDDGSPAIDGLYIFPEPQEQDRGDGFVEFRVTAYGRTSVFQSSNIERGSVRGTYTHVLSYTSSVVGGESRPAGSIITQFPSINETYTLRGVLAFSDSTGLALAKPTIATPMVYPIGGTTPLVAREILGPFGTDDAGRRTRGVDRLTLNISLESYSAASFGTWAEYTVTWLATATQQTGSEYY
jgi:hypothetical protein